ncbi:helix-turn-helix domain-containing protein [Pseudoalteromonas sp. 1181_04]|uniref:helix-turn-helix domain-containing protein n=1 Tax=Pseudoalteromonas sp. 1181_04 TaxID=2604450 RepID=UPI0040631826
MIIFILMRKFDALCLTTVHEFTPEKVRSLGNKIIFPNLYSLAILMLVITSEEMEQGESKPRDAALKMLSLPENKALAAIA